MHAYKPKDLERIFGISAAALRSLVRAGHVKPRLAQGGLRAYSFQDLILLRAANALRNAGISGHKINCALRELRAAFPAEIPLSGLSLGAAGGRVAVRRGPARWEAESGQYLLALEGTPSDGSVTDPDRHRGARHSEEAARAAHQADEAFKEAYLCEFDDPAGAIAGYRHCLGLESGHREARINLGRLLHEAGRLAEAERVYREAPAGDCDTLFNLGVLLEDMHRESDAQAAYASALALNRDCADAHYNLARLHDAAGRVRDSLRHLLAYRRLNGNPSR